MTLTYVYCLVRSDRRPSLRGTAPGITGSSGLRVLDAGSGCWLIVSQVPAAEYDEAALARNLADLDWVGPRALAHEAVVEHFLGARAVLPMPLMTLFSSDERAVTHLMRNRRRVERLLARLERQLEWGLRLTFDDSAPPAARRAPSGTGRPRAGMARAGSGLEYLSRKREQLGGRSERLQQARSAGDRLYRALAREATSAVRRRATERMAPGAGLVVDAAFLVPKDRTRSFQSAVRQHARAVRASGLVVSLTGPWPPYNFVGSRRGAAS